MVTCRLNNYHHCVSVSNFHVKFLDLEINALCPVIVADVLFSTIMYIVHCILYMYMSPGEEQYTPPDSRTTISEDTTRVDGQSKPSIGKQLRPYHLLFHSDSIGGMQ